MSERTPLLEAPEAAAWLGVSKSRLYELVRLDLVPHVKLGRALRFDADAIDAWIKAGGQGLPGGWRREAA